MAAWIFLVVSLIGAALVWNVHHPSFANARLGFLSYLLGWLEAELAIHHVAWQGLATLGFVAAGALASPVGWLALGVTLASWGALLQHYRSGAAVEQIAGEALARDLGADYEMRIEPELRPALRRGVDWRAIAVPFPVRAPGVERIRDLVYARVDGIELKLDLYRRRDRGGPWPDEPRPVLLYAHGGGWVIGSKNAQGLPLCAHMAQRGWICLNADYRLSPRATFPDHLLDLKRALRWLREEGAAWGCDADFVVTAGGSAGGHLAALLALTPNDPALQPGFEASDTSVQGCVPLYGVYDFTPSEADWRHPEHQAFLEHYVMKTRYADAPAAFERASPLHRVNAAAPPFFVIHGAADTLVPVGEARAFVAALRAESKSPVAYLEVPGAQHAFELFPSLRSDRVRQAIERYLALLHSEHRRHRATA